jgi:hypothetical protein
MLAGIRPRSLRSIASPVSPIPDRAVSSAGPPSRSSSRATAIFAAVVASLPVMGLPARWPVTCLVVINRNALAGAGVRRCRGAKRGANAGRRQATPGDGQPWFVQLDGPSGHVQPRAATGRMRLKSHMSPMGASRERENPDRCGEVRGWGCCRLMVLLADSAAGSCAGDGGGLPVPEPGFFPGIGVR